MKLTLYQNRLIININDDLILEGATTGLRNKAKRN